MLWGFSVGFYRAFIFLSIGQPILNYDFLSLLFCVVMRGLRYPQ